MVEDGSAIRLNVVVDDRRLDAEPDQQQLDILQQFDGWAGQFQRSIDDSVGGEQTPQQVPLRRQPGGESFV